MNTMTTNQLASCDLNSSYHSITASGKFCSSIYDGKTCWPFAKADTNVSQPCPTEILFDKMNIAHKYCTEDGRWENVTNLFGSTDYSTCYSKELINLLKTLGSDDEIEQKTDIAANIVLLEVIGFLISMIALIISLIIFIRYKVWALGVGKGLLEQRFKIHMNFFGALLLEIVIKLILDIYKMDFFKTDNIRSIVTCQVDCNNKALVVENTPYVETVYTPMFCQLIQVIMEWAKMASFMWMFIEGFYLYKVIKSNVIRRHPIRIRIYMIGWGLPSVFTSVWLLVTINLYENSLSDCWLYYSLLPSFLILDGIRITIIIVNFIILMFVLRKHWMMLKSRQIPLSKIEVIRKISEAAITIIPLLGITNFILLFVPDPHRKSVELFAFWSFMAHILHSLHGLMLSVLYCYTDNEVKNIIVQRTTLREIQRNFEMEMA